MCQPILSDYLAKKKITLSKREKLERMKKKKSLREKATAEGKELLESHTVSFTRLWTP